MGIRLSVFKDVMRRQPAQKISKKRFTRHLQRALLVLVTFFAELGSFAQSKETPIACYRTADPAKGVVAFRQRMPAPVTDMTFRASIHQKLPAGFNRITVEDST